MKRLNTKHMKNHTWHIVAHVSQEPVGGPLVTRIESLVIRTTPFTFAKRGDVAAKNAVDLSGVSASGIGGSAGAAPAFFIVGPSLLLLLSHRLDDVDVDMVSDTT